VALSKPLQKAETKTYTFEFFENPTVHFSFCVVVLFKLYLALQFGSQVTRVARD
jgi:hypothetical protein